MSNQLVTVQINGLEIKGNAEEVQQMLLNLGNKKQKAKPDKPEKYSPLRPYREGMEATVPKAKKSESFQSADDYKKVRAYLESRPYRGESEKNPNSWMKYRNLLLLVMGCTTALRISDLLNLVICQVVNPDGSIADTVLPVRERKTDKKNVDIPLVDDVRAILWAYLNSLPSYKMDDYLFQSRKKNKHGEYVITPQQAYRIITEAAKGVGLPYHVGTHTMRKTFGTIGFEMHPEEIGVIQHTLNHSTPQQTLVYIDTMAKRRRMLAQELSEVLNGDRLINALEGGLC